MGEEREVHSSLANQFEAWSTDEGHQNDMSVPKLITLLCSLATSICAIVAAIYWYLSSKQDPVPVETTDASISDYPEAHIMDTQAGVYALQVALIQASRLNKIAALWSAAAAGLGAIAAVTSAL